MGHVLPRSRNFNPRACVRHDMTLLEYVLSHKHFNPRACVRHDTLIGFLIICAGIPIHVPA